MLTADQIPDLRMSADKAKMEGRFEAGERLHELLDAFEDAEKMSGVLQLAEEARDKFKDACTDITRVGKKAGAYSHAAPDVDDMDVIDLRAEVTKLRKALEDIHDLADP